MTLREWGAALVVAVLLGGCAVAPGIRMDTDPGTEVRTIDASLIAEQRRARLEAEERINQPRRELVDGHQYRIGPGDVLNIVVWGHPELSNPMGQFQNIEQQARLVREDGTMFFPFVGVMEVAGLTIEEIRLRIARDLRPYVSDPQVDARVVAFRSQKVYVTGEVREPGTIALTDEPLTALDAINRMGGFGEAADRRRAVLTREGRQTSLDILELYASGRGDLLLQDRDVLFVPDNQYNRVFVMGEVGRQSIVPLHEGRLTLAEAISQSEGLDLGTADTRNIFVLRGIPEPDGVRVEVYQLDARSGVALILAEGFDLAPRDIVYVASTGMVRFNRVIQQILPTVQALWQTDRILRD